MLVNDNHRNANLATLAQQHLYHRFSGWVIRPMQDMVSFFYQNRKTQLLALRVALQEAEVPVIAESTALLSSDVTN